MCSVPEQVFLLSSPQQIMSEVSNEVLIEVDRSLGANGFKTPAKGDSDTNSDVSGDTDSSGDEEQCCYRYQKEESNIPMEKQLSPGHKVVQDVPNEIDREYCSNINTETLVTQEEAGDEGDVLWDKNIVNEDEDLVENCSPETKQKMELPEGIPRDEDIIIPEELEKGEEVSVTFESISDLDSAVMKSDEKSEKLESTNSDANMSGESEAKCEDEDSNNSNAQVCSSQESDADIEVTITLENKPCIDENVIFQQVTDKSKQHDLALNSLYESNNIYFPTDTPRCDRARSNPERRHNKLLECHDESDNEEQSQFNANMVEAKRRFSAPILRYYRVKKSSEKCNVLGRPLPVKTQTHKGNKHNHYDGDQLNRKSPEDSISILKPSNSKSTRTNKRPGVARMFQIATNSGRKGAQMGGKVIDFIKVLHSKGIWMSDPRLRETFLLIETEADKLESELTKDVFARVCEPNFQFIRTVLLNQLTIPGFDSFHHRIAKVFDSISLKLQAMENVNEIASQISDPTCSYLSFMLNRRNIKESKICLAVCSVDGQRLSLGEEDGFHPLNVCATILNYCMACRQNGIEIVEKFIGGSPNPCPEDEFSMDDNGRVWNPFTKAGAILTAALLNQNESIPTSLQSLHETYLRAMAGEPICCDNLSYNLKRLYAHEEISLAYFLSAKQKLPKSYTLTPGDALELFFQSTSTATSCNTASILAGTLAAGGVCPLTGERVFPEEVVDHVLNMMRSSSALVDSDASKQTPRISIAWSEYGSTLLVIPGVLGITFYTQCQSTDVMRELATRLVQDLESTFNFSVYRKLKRRTTSFKVSRK